MLTSNAVDTILNEIDQMIDKAWGMPLSGGKCLIDADRLREYLDSVRSNMPDVVRQAKGIVADRVEIVDTAKKEAEDIVRAAEERARALVMQEEIVKQAQQKANEIMMQTQKKCREMRKGTQDFAEDLLKRCEETLAKQVNEVHQTRQMIRKPQSEQQ